MKVFSLLKISFDIMMIGLGVLVIGVSFGKAVTGDYEPQWYWRVIGTFAAISSPILIRDHGKNLINRRKPEVTK